MPSKIEYELTRLRGEVSESQELYTDTIAALKDKITILETKVTSLDAELESNKQKTDNAMSKASKGVSLAKNNSNKLIKCILHDCIIDEVDATTHPYTIKGQLIYYNNKLYFSTGTTHELITSAIVE